MGVPIIVASIALALMALVLALRLFPLPGWRWSAAAFAAAVVLMGGQVFLALYEPASVAQ
jgi:hypothetical protein